MEFFKQHPGGKSYIMFDISKCPKCSTPITINEETVRLKRETLVDEGMDCKEDGPKLEGIPYKTGFFCPDCWAKVSQPHE